MTYSIYRNLHNGKLSIKEKASGLVVGYCDTIELQNARFKVNTKGVARIRAKQRKEVVATVQGGIRSLTGFISRLGRGYHEVLPYLVKVPTQAVAFNPYKFTSFVNADTLEPVYTADLCRIDGTGKMLISNQEF